MEVSSKISESHICAPTTSRRNYVRKIQSVGAGQPEHIELEWVGWMCWVTPDMLTVPRLVEYLRLKPPSEIYSFVLRGCRNSGKSSKYIVKVILNLQILAKWNVMCPCEDVNTSPKVGQKSWQPSLVFITRSPESWGQPQQLAGGVIAS